MSSPASQNAPATVEPTQEGATPEPTIQTNSDPEKQGRSESANPGGEKNGSASPSQSEREDGELPPAPLPTEPIPEDDGWDYDTTPDGLVYFFNRFTGVRQWENPRVPEATGSLQTSMSGQQASMGFQQAATDVQQATMGVGYRQV